MTHKHVNITPEKYLSFSLTTTNCLDIKMKISFFFVFFTLAKYLLDKGARGSLFISYSIFCTLFMSLYTVQKKHRNKDVKYAYFTWVASIEDVHIIHLILVIDIICCGKKVRYFIGQLSG